jgi:hypothetical protein
MLQKVFTIQVNNLVNGYWPLMMKSLFLPLFFTTGDANWLIVVPATARIRERRKEEQKWILLRRLLWQPLLPE